MNRWTVVIGALIVQICLGAIYAWSVFVEPLESLGFSRTQTQIIFSVALGTYALVMVFAGRLQDKIGPRKVALAGGIILGLGYIMAGLLGNKVDNDNLFWLTVFSIGVVGGAGIGFAYVCPIAAGLKWFPDKRGLITGLAVAGFGGGAYIFSRIASYFIAEEGVIQAFLMLGIIFLVCIVLGSLLLKNPPPGWTPKGWTPEKSKKSIGTDYEWKDMIKTSNFWFLWLMFAFGAASGLMVIGHIKPFGIASGVSAETAGAAVGILAIFNATGRIVWGVISDKIGRGNAMVVMFFLQAIMMFILIKMGCEEITLAIAAAWIGFNFGGNFTLFPSTTADFFGTKNIGVNYALVFTAFGVAGIVGPILGGKVFDATGSYSAAFIAAGVLCVISSVLGLKVRKNT
jgi:MFS transporter, OFA family, oxalate/formate antiporter